MKRLLFLLGILFAISLLQLRAQEQLVPLDYNPILLQNKSFTNPIKGNQEAIKLPFVDDFSSNLLFPKQSLWDNYGVFTNKSYGVEAPSIGVATFDAVNDTGYVYSYAGQYPFIADILTSNDIRLDSSFGSFPNNLSPSDSVVLSFFFQPEGLGNPPEEGDSLILQFYKPNQNHWATVWSHEGIALDSFVTRYGTSFKQILISIADTAYFSPNFRFRFMNKASIPNSNIPSWRSGLYDHWNLDYVYLDYNRSVINNDINDIAISEGPQSALLNYISMPWNQYLLNAAGETNSQMEIKFRNLSASGGLKNLNQYFSITNLDNGHVDQSASFPSTFNMNPGQVSVYAPDYGTYSFQSNASPYADFEILFRILTNTPPLDIVRSNDSLRFYQKFYNYYAYDDGIPEAGYGLSTNNGKLAYKFTLNGPDSLQAIQMYFNTTLGNASQQYFYLTIWDDNNGEPGSIIYEKQGKRPEYNNELFKYYTYPLEQALFLSGTFYIGWRQLTNDNLNIGFDKNNNQQNKIFYNTTGSWTNSSFQGALMMRPIMGNEKTAFVGLSEENTPAVLKIYPNPFQDVLNIQYNGMEVSKANILVYNSIGQIVIHQKLETQLSLSTLDKGIYFIKIISENGKSIHQQKIIKQ